MNLTTSREIKFHSQWSQFASSNRVATVLEYLGRSVTSKCVKIWEDLSFTQDLST